MPQPALVVDRWILGAALVLTACLFTARAADPVNVIKMTALVFCAIALVTAAAVRVIRSRVVQVPWGAPAAAAVVLLAAFAVAAFTAPVTTQAVLGAYGRNSGLLVYGSALVLFLGGLRVLDRPGTRVVLYALVLAGSFTASYGLLQYAGLDNVNWNNPFNPIIAALGNPNFAAAYLAICLPAATWGAVRRGWPTPWRVLSGVIAFGCLLAALLSQAAQGPLAAAPGLAVLAVAWLLDRPQAERRTGLALLGTVTTAGLAALGAGVAGIGPAAGVFGDVGSRARGHYWEGALSVWRDQPVLGAGLETFGSYWRQVRSEQAVRELGGSNFSDAVHSVPLQLLATGGVLLALAYLAFVVVVGIALVRGLRRLTGEDRLLLGAVGGCWVAYQVQSLVSIDQVPLIVTQYVLAAAVVVAAGAGRLCEVRLPGALPVAPTPTQQPGRKRRATPLTPRVRALTPVDRVALGLVAVLALGLAWWSLVPLRANAAALLGDAALAQGDADEARRQYDKAVDLVPGEPRYWQKQGQLFERAQMPTEALQAYRRGTQADPLDVPTLRAAAQLAEQQGDLELARELHGRALDLDPNTPRTVLLASQFALRHEQAALAREWLERLVALLPDEAGLLGALGDARAVTGDPEGARAAYERALQLEPGQETATAGLAKLQVAPAAG